MPKSLQTVDQSIQCCSLYLKNYFMLPLFHLYHFNRSCEGSPGQLEAVLSRLFTSIFLHVLLLSPSVFWHQHHRGHRCHGRSPRAHHRPPGWPFAAPQRVHVPENSEQPAQHTVNLPGHPQATGESLGVLQWELHLLRLGGMSGERRETCYSQGECWSLALPKGTSLSSQVSLGFLYQLPSLLPSLHQKGETRRSRWRTL